MSLCDGCSIDGKAGACCHYASLDTPMAGNVVDVARIAQMFVNNHLSISVSEPFIFSALGDPDRWHVELEAPCKYQHSGRCSIYEDRPNICAWYQPKPTDHFDGFCERYGQHVATRTARTLAEFQELCRSLFGLLVEPAGLPECDLPTDDSGFVDLDVIRWQLSHSVDLYAVFDNASSLPINHIDRWRLFVVRPELDNPDLRIIENDVQMLELIEQLNPDWKVREPVRFKTLPTVVELL